MESLKRLLVIEDDASIVSLLELVFENDYEVISTPFGKDIISVIQQYEPSLIILDIGLPDVNGMDLICVIRERSKVPIIMLTGKNSDLEKVTSFNYGADDYVVKPFSVAELMARVKAILRRNDENIRTALSHIEETMAENSKPGIHIDTEQQRVFVNNQEIFLTFKEFELLKLFLTKKGRVLTREIILDHIWGINNVEIETRAVDACISRLRKKLNAVSDQNNIVAVAGLGYRMSV